jgi:hypothetical protein
MADLKISALPASTTPLAGTEVLPIVQSSTTRQVSVANLTAGRAVSALSIATTTGATFATTSGNVGIGTSSPSYSLDVVSSGTFVSRFQNGSNQPVFVASVSGLSGIVSESGSQNGWLMTSASNYVTAYTNGTERMRIDSSGNLGLGVTPSAWGSSYKAIDLNTYGAITSSTSELRIWANAYQGASSYIYKTTSAATLYDMSGGAYRWYNAPSGTAGNAITFTTAMTLDNSGNLLVGTTSRVYTERVSINYTGVGQGIVLNTTSTSSSDQIVFNNGNGTVGKITTNASLTVYNTTSDYRLKNVIGSVSDSGQRLDALEPIEYDFKTGGRTRGFLAHQFAEVYPNSVSGEKDAVDKEGKPVYQSMQASTSEVMADLIAEIQSLRKRVALLESK